MGVKAHMDSCLTLKSGCIIAVGAHTVAILVIHYDTAHDNKKTKQVPLGSVMHSVL
jgi:hypothetical protein